MRLSSLIALFAACQACSSLPGWREREDDDCHLPARCEAALGCCRITSRSSNCVRHPPSSAHGLGRPQQLSPVCFLTCHMQFYLSLFLSMMRGASPLISHLGFTFSPGAFWFRCMWMPPLSRRGQEWVLEQGRVVAYDSCLCFSVTSLTLNLQPAPESHVIRACAGRGQSWHLQRTVQRV